MDPNAQNTPASPAQPAPAPTPDTPLASESGSKGIIETIKNIIAEDKMILIIGGVFLLLILAGGLVFAFSGKGSSTGAPTTVTIPTYNPPNSNVDTQFQTNTATQSASPSATPTATPSASPTASASASPSASASASPS